VAANLTDVEALKERLAEPDWHDPACPFSPYCYCGEDGEPPPHDRVYDGEFRRQALAAYDAAIRDQNTDLMQDSALDKVRGDEEGEE